MKDQTYYAMPNGTVGLARRLPIPGEHYIFITPEETYDVTARGVLITEADGVEVALWTMAGDLVEVIW